MQCFKERTNELRVNTAIMCRRSGLFVKSLISPVKHCTVESITIHNIQGRVFDTRHEHRLSFQPP